MIGVAPRSEVLRRVPMLLLGSYAWATTFLDRPAAGWSPLSLVSLGLLWLGIPLASELALRSFSLFGFLASTGVAVVLSADVEPFGLAWYGWLGWFGFVLTWGLTPPSTEGEPSRVPLPPRREVSRRWILVPLLGVLVVVGLGVPLRDVSTVERYALAVVLLLTVGLLLVRALTDLVPAVDAGPRTPAGFARALAFACVVGLSIALWVAG